MFERNDDDDEEETQRKITLATKRWDYVYSGNTYTCLLGKRSE